MKKRKQKKEWWKLYDAAFFSGLISFLEDSSDRQKFKQILLQIALGILMTAILFYIGFKVIT